MRLVHKISLSFLAVIVILGVCNFFAMQYLLKNLQEERMRTAEVIFAKSLSREIYRMVIDERIDNITALLFDEKGIREEKIEYILVFDKKGYLLAHTYISSMPKILLDLNNKFSKGEDYRIEKITTKGISSYDIAVPINEGIKQVGTIHIGIKSSFVQNIVTKTRTASTSSLAITSFVALIGIVSAVFLSKTITYPISEFQKTAQKIGEGDLATKINIKTSDEIGLLSKAFNGMVLNLKRTMSELDKHKSELEDIVEERTSQLKEKVVVAELQKEEINKNYRQQELLSELLSFSWGNISLEEILDEFIGRLVSIPWITEESMGAIFLLGEEEGTLELKAFRGLDPELSKNRCVKLRLGQCLCGKAALSSEILFVDHIDHSHEIHTKEMREHGHYCIPIVSFENKVIGVINLYVTAGSKHNINVENFLRAVAKVLANIVERKKAEKEIENINKKLENSQKKTITMLKDLQKANKILKDNEKEIRILYGDAQTANERLKEAQNQLIQSEKLASIGQLAAGVAHEINNPIGFISSNIQSLEDYCSSVVNLLSIVESLKKSIKDKDMDKVDSLVSKIENIEEDINLDFIINDMDDLLRESLMGIDQIKKIVLDLRVFAREDKGQMEKYRIEDVIDGIIRIVQNEIKYKCELKKDFSDLPLVKCNPQRLGQVFVNLIMNASQSIEENGLVSIRTYQKNGSVCVDISDNGEGISEDNLNKIFDPFFTTKPVGEGTGLGLSISYEIVKKHGGDISVASKEGVGTTFTIMLPIPDRN